jgi:hypothetical protein
MHPHQSRNRTVQVVWHVHGLRIVTEADENLLSRSVRSGLVNIGTGWPRLDEQLTIFGFVIDLRLNKIEQEPCHNSEDEVLE